MNLIDEKELERQFRKFHEIIAKEVNESIKKIKTAPIASIPLTPPTEKEKPTEEEKPKKPEIKEPPKTETPTKTAEETEKR